MRTTTKTDAALFDEICQKCKLPRTNEATQAFSELLLNIRFLSDSGDNKAYSDSLDEVKDYLLQARKKVLQALCLIRPSKQVYGFSLNEIRLGADDFSDQLEDLYVGLNSYIAICKRKHRSTGRGLKKDILIQGAVNSVYEYWKTYSPKKMSAAKKQKMRFTEAVIRHCWKGLESRKSGLRFAMESSHKNTKRIKPLNKK